MNAIIALGSNLGDRLASLKAAATEVAKLGGDGVRKSAVYQTTPVDCPPGSQQFLNAVIVVDVNDDISPLQLLRELRNMETRLGRTPKKIMNEPRLIDLDLISRGSVRIDTPELTLPHPRAHLRRFVLQPLCDVAPDLVLPGQTKTVRELLAALPDDGSVRLFAREW